MFRPGLGARFFVANGRWHIPKVRATITARLVAKTARWRLPLSHFTFLICTTPLVFLSAATRARIITSNFVHDFWFRLNLKNARRMAFFGPLPRRSRGLSFANSELSRQPQIFEASRRIEELALVVIVVRGLARQGDTFQFGAACPYTSGGASAA